MNYKVEDVVLYGGDGVCRIVGIVERNIGGVISKYYDLKPIYDERSTIYVPVSNERLVGKMHDILSNDEVAAAIDEACSCTPCWIDNADERKNTFRLAVDSGDITSLIKILREIYIQKEKRTENSRKLHVADERALKEIERVLLDVLAFSLEMDRGEVKQFLIGKFEI